MEADERIEQKKAEIIKLVGGAIKRKARRSRPSSKKSSLLEIHCQHVTINFSAPR